MSIIKEEDALQAIRTLLKWIGEDPEREGLIDTPKRVINSYKELFAGYHKDPEQILSRTFEETENYNDIILLKDISFKSFCEHHMLPIIGTANIAYLPNQKVVGISKLARIVDCFAMRLQIQERMTVQIAETIEKILKPKGVAVMITATHQCMSQRGTNKDGVSMQTSHYTGCFKSQDYLSRLMNMMLHSK
ncbi:GTP cyclohydrolase I FolE [Rickettsiales endosymbiont of Stachyamoeba lipophora]|uniref:GTP cyclohydrolase I FolE n=1 Tax=Rickettsiales endosymbiont of Stachyamoeba lipophora TaxID=2486578 RepID=UPI000F64D617|nr:GTP cyclohydrolase I FolE [Rickettsiales endosymbiont of Stachyamoeba lipophora]AZL15342.1 GTP cyclohydrolase I FolE [Rickettsiales endosymbiont of Stachyamoeba lipophora]